MAQLVRHSRKPIHTRAAYPARGEPPPPRVSTILCLILAGMTLLVFIGKAFTSLFAAS
ncbi:hypothetical protein SAMCFNEI73_pC0854 (plasmid) [Sinorhizobium americanum]|uniref:Uncharacterized protein n=1 Tax=Sinorhizobium americanum TaxID=194963 RepID=A0A1L3LWU0_9HYPH|nr:hypothetical protein [Sinorhizobium americanum]APG94567.1 hypothetical protein SAMCFNEI73_pC0854 [Sinorhizobium americanum]